MNLVLWSCWPYRAIVLLVDYNEGVFANRSHVLCLARHVSNNWRQGLDWRHWINNMCVQLLHHDCFENARSISLNAVLVVTYHNNCSHYYISHRMTAHTMKFSHKREELTS